MGKVTLITDSQGNIVGGHLGSRSDTENYAAGKTTIVALDGQQVHYDVSLTSELLKQDNNESLVKELLAHRINAQGQLERKK